MLQRDHLYLRNTHANNLTFQVEQYISIRGPTLRPERVKKIDISVPRSSIVDLTMVLCETKAKCLSILSQSPDVTKLCARGWLAIVDPEDTNSSADSLLPNVERTPTEERKNALEVKRAVTAELIKHDLVNVQDVPKILLPEVPLDVAIIADTLKDIKDAVDKVADKVAQVATVEPQVATDTVVPLSAVVASNIPSAQWNRVRLAEYATQRGIAIAEEDTKNIILRKIREDSK